MDYVWLNCPGIKIPSSIIQGIGCPHYLELYADGKILRFVPCNRPGPKRMTIDQSILEGKSNAVIMWPRMGEYFTDVCGWEEGQSYLCIPQYEGNVLVLDLEKRVLPVLRELEIDE